MHQNDSRQPCRPWINILSIPVNFETGSQDPSYSLP
jgi:hypothetical protein